MVSMSVYGGAVSSLWYGTYSYCDDCDDGVFICFRPFHQDWVVFGFEDIQDVEPLTYSPLRDYGGWGIRYGREGKAYNVSGYQGILLGLKGGSNVLIGSNNHQALCAVIEEKFS
jgi:hypothetical protein